MKLETHRSRMAAVGAVALLLAACGGSSSSNSSKAANTSSSSAKGPIRIGVLTSLTGLFQPWGLQARDGMQFAVNEINSSGGINGTKLQLFVADDQSQPAAGVGAFKRLTEQDHVIAIGGVIDSDVGVATARLAEAAQIPYFMSKAGSSQILTSSSRYTFRTCLPAAQEIAGAYLQYAATRGLDRVGAINADYAWGHAFGSGLQTAASKNPNLKVKAELAPVDTTDFTTYLRGLTGFNPQLIVATGHPPGTPPILVQSGKLGLNVPVTGPDFPSSLIAKAVGQPAFGRYIDFKCMLVDSPGYQNLARQFLTAFPRDRFFEDDALASYAVVNILAQAIKSVGANPAKIASYVHANTFNIPGFAYPLQWTSWGELAQARLAIDLLTPGPAPHGVNIGGTWYLKQLLLSKPLTPFTP
ncbi:MAG: ABC transporter substrate-binding protein [Solirubrobacterales bacterium]|nr:ABC transporter substrate-binding protein [Solirubrobacterales bacterium]